MIFGYVNICLGIEFIYIDIEEVFEKFGFVIFGLEVKFIVLVLCCRWDIVI